MKSSFTIEGNIVDVIKKRIFQGEVEVENNTVKNVIEKPTTNPQYIMPGFVDAHVHIESSMLIPSEFARLAVVHGTVATVSDPHEIGNVLGVEGVKYMIENGKKVPFKFHFGAPSCVPATTFETAGATIDVNGVEQLLNMQEVCYLAEVMNFPGVLNRDKAIMQKISIAKKLQKAIDGHAPGLRGEDVIKYASAGITTDHECFTKEEALDKINAGIKIIIREGSAAKNFDALIDLLKNFPEKIMLCSDDKHPNDLVVSHINQLAKRAILKGCNKMDVICAATKNPVEHYKMNVGLLQPGEPADFIIVENLFDFKIKATYINGVKVAENGLSLIPRVKEKIINNFNCNKICMNDISVVKNGEYVNVIEVMDGQLITNKLSIPVGNFRLKENEVFGNPDKDILKMIVVNRYHEAKPAVGFIKNFGLKKGAIASSVAHDSHNIIAVGADDKEIINAINLLIDVKGGVSISDKKLNEVLPLPVAGLMSAKDGYDVAKSYDRLDKLVKSHLGCTLNSPYMTLSFCALLVIPDLKLSDKGLFSGKEFKFFPLFT